MEIIYHQSERLTRGLDSCVFSAPRHYATAADAENEITDLFTGCNEVNTAFCKSLFEYRAVYLRGSENGHIRLIACHELWDDVTNIPPLDLGCYKLKHTTVYETPTESEKVAWAEKCFKDRTVKLAVLSDLKGQILAALMRNGQTLIPIAGSGT